VTVPELVCHVHRKRLSARDALREKLDGLRAEPVELPAACFKKVQPHLREAIARLTKAHRRPWSSQNIYTGQRQGGPR
jgi:hypothetical protein